MAKDPKPKSRAKSELDRVDPTPMAPVAAFFTARVKDRAAELGRSDTVIADRAGEVVIGIPLPQPALRYFFGNDVFRLGMFGELIGPPGAGKTALQAELHRWHIYNTAAPPPTTGFDPAVHSGACFHIAAEPRFTPDLLYSILQVPFQYERVEIVSDIRVVEDWQARFTFWWKRMRDHQKLPAGWLAVPVSGGLDSLTAVNTEGTDADILEKGYVVQDFARIAGSVTTYFRSFFNWINGWPISVVATNHLKTSKDKRGFNVHRTPGGLQQEFAGTTVTRVELKERTETLKENARTLKLIAVKNSVSSAGDLRDLEVRMRWRYHAGAAHPGNPQGQQTIFDWDEATVALLAKFEGARAKRIEDIVGPLTLVDTTRRGDAPDLGLKRATWTEIGAAIRETPKMVAALDDMFGVTRRIPFEIGVPYSEQVRRGVTAARAVEAAAAAAAPPPPGEAAPPAEEPPA